MKYEKTVFRHEKKYVLMWQEAEIIKKRLERVIRKDEHGSYSVSSLYFDSPYDLALFEKLDGNKIRHKFRIRAYNGEFNKLKLERKSKWDAMTVKNSVYISNEKFEAILNGKNINLDSNELEKIFGIKLRFDQYRPKVIVDYERVAYCYPIGDLRITFDSNIKKSTQVKKFGQKECNFMRVYEPGSVIMEVKFNHDLPTFVRQIIQSPHTMASSASKYANARTTSVLI